jgi:ankyrin repeat protein
LFKIINRFRWVYCQLEILRDCLPPSVRRTLNELPESLDETYERVLKEIKKPNRDHARRLLSCLVVAVRPLYLDELAEVLAVDFEDEEGIPTLNPNWRWEDQEQAVLTSCSSLIALVKSGRSRRVVQFSHFSVKEFLTSARLATSSVDVLRYHITPGPAHIILAQACLSIFFRLDDRVEQTGAKNSSPLSKYAIYNWTKHAKYENMSPYLQKAIEYLFDPDKPYFATWRKSHNIDTDSHPGSAFFYFSLSGRISDAVPLYYAALCGFQDLAERLVVKYPQHVNARGGCYVTPLVAALAGGHFQIAKMLCDNGAHPNVEGLQGASPLHSAACWGYAHMVRVLLEYKADVHARSALGETPLHYVAKRVWVDREQLLDDVVRILLEHGADIEARSKDQSTPLHLAARWGRPEVVPVLLEHGASMDAEDAEGRTPLRVALWKGYSHIAELLTERGAK